MFRLEDLTLFVRAAALGSFSDAAREAGQQPAQVSAAIKRLETILNIRLFARSTRSLRLTPEGETWLPYATQMLDTLEAGLQKIQTPDDEVRGMLQIAVPSDLGRNLLLTLFRDFRQRHPALRLRLLFSDQLTDVFKDPVDVAFRYGNNDDASFISLPVAPENRRVLVASPEWIARHGDPRGTQPAQCVDLHFARPSVRPLVAEPRRRGSAAEGFRHGDERRRRGDPSAGDRRGGHCL